MDLGTCLFRVNALSNQKRAMRRGMRKIDELKLALYADRLIDIDEYIVALYREKASEIIDETELNEILLNRMPSIWIRQTYVQGFYCECITFNKL